MKTEKIKSKIYYTIKNLLLCAPEQVYTAIYNCDNDFYKTSIYINRNAYTIDDLATALRDYVLSNNLLEKFIKQSVYIAFTKLNECDVSFADTVRTIVDSKPQGFLKGGESGAIISIGELTGIGELFGSTETHTQQTTAQQQGKNTIMIIVAIVVFIIFAYFILKSLKIL